MKKCLNCQSENITHKPFLEDKAHGNAGLKPEVRLDKDPQAIFFKETVRLSTTTFVCLNCGYIALFCSDVKNLADAAKQAL